MGRPLGSQRVGLHDGGRASAGLLFLPLGTPTPDFYGGSRKGSNLYGSSLVALDAATGKLKWYFQTTHHDNWDYDLTSAPVPDRCDAGRQEDSRRGAVDQAGPAVHLQSLDRRTDL